MNLDKSVDNILFERYVPCTIWCDPWPSWVVGYFGASWGSFFLFCWSSSLSWLWLLPLITGACCRNSWPPLPHKIAEVEPGACFFFACFCACVYVCVWMRALLAGFDERQLMLSREMTCCPSLAGYRKSCMSGRGGSGTSPSEQPRLLCRFWNLASGCRCIAAVVAVVVVVVVVIVVIVVVIVVIVVILVVVVAVAVAGAVVVVGGGGGCCCWLLLLLVVVVVVVVVAVVSFAVAVAVVVVGGGGVVDVVSAVVFFGLPGPQRWRQLWTRRRGSPCGSTSPVHAGGHGSLAQRS